MSTTNYSRLKYICSSFASNISTGLLTEEKNDKCRYEVYGASGFLGFYNTFYSQKEYLGIIKDGAGVGRINKYPPRTSILGTMAYIVPNSDIDIDWLKYCIQSLNLTESLDKTTIPHIYFSEYGNEKVAIFDKNTQIQIATFLNSKCSLIEIILNQIEEQIKLLEDYKKSIISETVSRGLNKGKTLKNSGMGWIEAIPENWSVARIASVYKQRNTKVNDRDYLPLSVTMKGIVPQLESAAKTDAHDDRKLVCKGDFAINSRSDRRGSCGISPCDGSISLINIVLCPLRNMNPGYYNWLFHTVEFADEFYKYGHGIVDDLWTTSWQEMKNILIPQPPLQEQAAIAAFLDKKCSEIDLVIKDKKAQYEVLSSYMKSLIFEYVTGKKEVSNE